MLYESSVELERATQITHVLIFVPITNMLAVTSFGSIERCTRFIRNPLTRNEYSNLYDDIQPIIQIF